MSVVPDEQIFTRAPSKNDQLWERPDPLICGESCTCRKSDNPKSGPTLFRTIAEALRITKRSSSGLGLISVATNFTATHAA